jgi:hypothetical protein
MSNVGDVSHVEIDTKQKQVAVYLKEKQEEALDEVENNSSQGSDVPVTTKPVILKKHDIMNLPWDLEPEKLTLFILNHTAWLNPVDEDGYKLAFRGGLLGGMKKSGGNQTNVYHCSKAPKTDNFCWVTGGNLSAPNSSWIGGNPGNVSIISNSNYQGESGQRTLSGSSGWQSILGKPWAKIAENHQQAVDRMQKQQENLKKLSTVGQPVEIYKRPEIISHNPFPQIRPPQPSLPFPEDWDSKVAMIDQGMTRLSWCEMYYLGRKIGVPDEVIEDWKNHRASNKVKLSDYLETKKKIEFEKAKKAEEAAKKKLQAIKEEQLKKLNQEKHNALVNSLSQKFMRQGRGFSEIKKPFQQTADGSIYKGSRYNVEFPLSPVELEACQGKTVCLYSHLKTDTSDVCRVQVVAFKGNVVVGNACSDAMPSGKWGYLFTALHFDFNDYDSVWVRPLRTGGTQDSLISAWSYSTWITDIPIKQEETSHVKVVQNSQKTVSFAFPDSPLVYPSFSKDRTTAESFLPSGVTLSSAAITTSDWAKYNYVCPGNIPDSHQHIVESTVYVINHALHEIMQDCSTGDEWDKAEAVSLIRYMTGQHLKRTNSESLENVSKVKGINYVTDYMLPSVIRYNLNEMQKKHEDNEPFDDQVVQDWAKTDWTGLVKQVGKKLPFDIDPMKPHDMFNLEDKMAGCGAGGGKLGWNRLLGKGKINPQNVVQHKYNYHERIRARAVEDPKGHNFPYRFDDAILKSKPTLQKDGSLLYRKEGFLNGKQGFFEIAINTETNTIFHRCFIGK